MFLIFIYLCCSARNHYAFLHSPLLQMITTIVNKRKSSTLGSSIKNSFNDKKSKLSKSSVHGIQVQFEAQRLFKVVLPNDNQIVEKNVSFRNHADNHISDQRNRIQNLVVTQTSETDKLQIIPNLEGSQNQALLVPLTSLSRSTCFIAKSHLYPEIFQTYYHLFLDSKANVTGCPARMPKLKLNTFNQHWSMLRTHLFFNEQLVDKQFAKDSDNHLSFLITTWIEKLCDLLTVPKKSSGRKHSGKKSPDSDQLDQLRRLLRENTPDQYYYLVTQPMSGDLILFEPGLIHCVFASTSKEIIRVKISSELVQSTERKDELTAGINSSPAKKFEIKRLDRVKEINHALTHGDVSFCREIKDQEIKVIAKQLRDLGVVVIDSVLNSNYSTFILNHSARYLHGLFQLPSNLDLLNPAQSALLFNKQKREQFGIQDHQIRRQAANSRSTHIPSGHGISKYGMKSQVLQQLFAEVLNPVFQQLYKSMYNSDTHYVNAPCIHFQPPA